MAEPQLALVVVPTSIRSNGRGPVTGDIWIVADREPFPAVGWNDFVVVVLAAFGNALGRIVRGSKKEIVYFMEGPYEVHVEPAVGGVLACTVDERNRTRHSVVVPAAELIASAVDSSTAVLLQCREDGCWSPDADELNDVVSMLRGEPNSVRLS